MWDLIVSVPDHCLYFYFLLSRLWTLVINVFAIGVNNILHFVFDSHFHNAGPTVLRIVLS